MPSRTCQPRLARQFGQRFVNWSSDNTIAAPKRVPIKLSWVRLEISKNSITPIETNTKSQKATNNPIVALWCWRNFFRSLADIRISPVLTAPKVRYRLQQAGKFMRPQNVCFPNADDFIPMTNFRSILFVAILVFLMRRVAT
jgi:hypothetical protein